MLTAPSSAVVPFPSADDKLSFATASKAWLKTVLADTELTPGEARLGAALFLHFNFEHYDNTSELIAWPAQETLMAETALGKTTVSKGINKLESRRLIEVERSRYDHATKKRAGNIYHVPPRYGRADLAHDHQGPGPRSETKVRPSGRDSVSRLGESRLGEKKERIKKIGNPRKQGQEKKEASEPSPSEAPSSDPVKTPYPPSSARPPSPLGREDRWADRWRREKAEAEATLEHYRAKVQNRGGQ